MHVGRHQGKWQLGLQMDSKIFDFIRNLMRKITKII
jgi:hypothetical protein